MNDEKKFEEDLIGHDIKSKEDIRTLKEKLEKIRNSKVILLTMDESRSIDRYLVSQIYDLMNQMNFSNSLINLDIIIHSSGGDGDADAAYHIAKILKNYCNGKLTFIVPRFAKSAATLLCCSGDTIIMDEPSELGPVDPQRVDYFRGERYSVLSIKETMKFLDGIEKDCNDNPEECNRVISEAIGNIPLMEIGDSLRQLNHIADYLHELLIQGMFREEYEKNPVDTENNIKKIILNLVHKHYSHSRCIDYKTAKDIGLKTEKVSKEEWNLIWNIFKIFEKEALIK